MTVDRDFFVSFTGADRPWAAWLLAELDAAGYSSVSQLRDFVAGGNFATEMHRAARRARRTLGVLSPQALRAPFVWQEWTQCLAADPTGEQRALVLVRVAPCEPEGCWARWSTSSWSAWTRPAPAPGCARNWPRPSAASA